MSDSFLFVSCQILRTKLISNAHVGFFCLSCVKFYVQNLNLTCPIWFFFSCQILCKTLISISLSEFCLFASCQILRTKSQASLFSAFKKSSALMVRDLCFPVQSAFFLYLKFYQQSTPSPMTAAVHITKGSHHTMAKV